MTPEEIADERVRGWNAPPEQVAEVWEIWRLNAELGFTDRCRSCAQPMKPEDGCLKASCHGIDRGDLS